VSTPDVWLKADAITGFADGASLTSWVDSSGNANTVATGYGTNPKYRATGGPLGLPCVDHTVAAGSLGKVGSHGLPTGDFTYFMVIQSGSSAVQNIMNANFTDSANNSAEVRLDNYNIAILKSGVSQVKKSAAALTPNTWTLVVVTFTSVGSVVHFDIGGTVEDYSVGGTTTFNDRGNFSYGSYQFGSTLFNGKTAEIGLYTSVLSSGDLISLKAYLNAKYFAVASRRATMVRSVAAQHASRW
jgi:hypothetical protein